MNPVTIFSFVEEMHKRLGETIHVSYGRFDEAFVTSMDTKFVESVLTNHVELTKTVDYNLLVPWTGHGLLMSTDKKWFQRRKVRLLIF